MSNLSKFMKGGKKKGDSPAEPAAPKPIAAPPLVEPVDKAKTRQVDCSAMAQADADQAQEDEVTTEIPGKAPPIYPSAPPIPVPPVPAPGKVVPITMAKAAPAAPVAEEPGEAEAKSPAPAAPAKAPPGKSLDIPKLLELIYNKLVKPLEDKVSALEGALASHEEALKGNDEMLNAVIEIVQGPAPESDEAKQAAGEGRPVGVVGEVAALSGALAELRTQLLGPNPAEALAPFEGEPVVPQLLEAFDETAVHVNELVGPGGERIPSLVVNNTALTARTLVIEMLKDECDSAKIRQACIEGGPQTSKDILNLLATNPEYAIEVVGAIRKSPAECLDDPKNAALKADVYSDAQKIVPRVQHYHDNLDWDAMEQEAAQYWAPESGPEQTGGDE